MEFSGPEIASYGGGLTVAVGLFTKYIVPLFNKLIKNNGEIAKMKFEAEANSSNAVNELLFDRIKTLESKEEDLQGHVLELEKNFATLNEKYNELTRKYTELKEKYAERTVLKSKKPKAKRKKADE